MSDSAEHFSFSCCTCLDSASALQPFGPSRLQCEAVRGHPSGTIVSVRYAFLLTDLFFPMTQEVRALPKARWEGVAVLSSCVIPHMTASRAQESKLMVHTPDCADLHKVQAIPWQAKAFNATLIGNAWDKLYPLRHTMKEAIWRGLIPGGEMMPHPGWARATLPRAPACCLLMAAWCKDMPKSSVASSRMLWTLTSRHLQVLASPSRSEHRHRGRLQARFSPHPERYSHV